MDLIDEIDLTDLSDDTLTENTRTVTAARDAYDALTEAGKALVPTGKVTALEEAEQAIEDFNTKVAAATAMKEAVAALPDAKTITDAATAADATAKAKTASEAIEAYKALLGTEADSDSDVTAAEEKVTAVTAAIKKATGKTPVVAGDIDTDNNQTLELVKGYAADSSKTIAPTAKAGITFSYAAKADAKNDEAFELNAETGAITFKAGKEEGEYVGEFTITATADEAAGSTYSGSATKDVTVTVIVSADAPVPVPASGLTVARIILLSCRDSTL